MHTHTDKCAEFEAPSSARRASKGRSSDSPTLDSRHVALRNVQRLAGNHGLHLLIQRHSQDEGPTRGDKNSGLAKPRPAGNGAVAEARGRQAPTKVQRAFDNNARLALDTAIAKSPNSVSTSVFGADVGSLTYPQAKDVIDRDVPPSEQDDLIDVGGDGFFFSVTGGQAVVRRFVQAYLLKGLAQPLEALRTKPDKVAQRPADPAQAKLWEKREHSRYLGIALNTRDMYKPLIHMRPTQPEVRSFLTSEGFGNEAAGTAEEQAQERALGPRIDVRASYSGSQRLQIRTRGHLFIVYTTAEGEQWVVRGGPGPYGEGGLESGYVHADVSRYGPGSVDWDPDAASVTVLKGPDSVRKFDAMIEAANACNDAKVPYKAVTSKLSLEGENCNATAYTVLTRAGVPAKKPTGIHPGWGKLLGQQSENNERYALPPKPQIAAPQAVRWIGDDDAVLAGDRLFASTIGTIPSGSRVELFEVGIEFGDNYTIRAKSDDLEGWILWSATTPEGPSLYDPPLVRWINNRDATLFGDRWATNTIGTIPAGARVEIVERGVEVQASKVTMRAKTDGLKGWIFASDTVASANGAAPALKPVLPRGGAPSEERVAFDQGPEALDERMAIEDLGPAAPGAAAPVLPPGVKYGSPENPAAGSPEAAALAWLPTFADLVPDSPQWNAADDIWAAFVMDNPDNFEVAADWMLFQAQKLTGPRKKAYEAEQAAKLVDVYPKFAGLEPDSPQWQATEVAWGEFFVVNNLHEPWPEWQAAKEFMEAEKASAARTWKAKQALPRGAAPGAPRLPNRRLPDANEFELIRLARLQAKDPKQAAEMQKALDQAQYLNDAFDDLRPAALKKQMERHGTRRLANALMEPLPEDALDPANPQAGLYARVADVAPLMKQYRLTPAEFFAIRTYTTADYSYINPAVAGDDAWMRQQIGLGRSDEGQFHAEGARHGKVLMQALAKLPVRAGTTYRGARVTEQGFQERYKPGSVGRLNTFLSTSESLDRAKIFANNDQQTTKNPQASISVMSEYGITHAYDVAPFSAHRDEAEWLLAPGSEFQETGREQFPDGSPGRNPTATQWWGIRHTQTKGPPDLPSGENT